MSYIGVSPQFYRMNQPDSPWHAGSSGWKSAPWVTWGDNPNQIGLPRLAMGEYTPAATGLPTLGPSLGQTPAWVGPVGILAVLGLAAWLLLNVKPAAGFAANRKWSRALKNRLPDSAFLYVEPGGHKERIGGRTFTVPRSKRKFPVRTRTGKLDLPHVRNAIARIPVADIPEALKPKLQAKARRLLARAHGAAA